MTTVEMVKLERGRRHNFTFKARGGGGTQGSGNGLISMEVECSRIEKVAKSFDLICITRIAETGEQATRSRILNLNFISDVTVSQLDQVSRDALSFEGFHQYLLFFLRKLDCSKRRDIMELKVTDWSGLLSLS